MDVWIIPFIDIFLLVIALSVDAFVASFAYGSDKIKIPVISVAIISSICSMVLIVSTLLGSFIKQFIPPHSTNIICFIILFILGTIKLFDSSIKSFIRKNANLKKELKFSAFNLSFILNIYADPQNADCDSSKILSPAEAAPLAFALSIDGLAVGIGAGLVTINFVEIVILSLLSNAIAVLLGSYMGYKIAESTDLNLSWISGTLLIILSFMKL